MCNVMVLPQFDLWPCCSDIDLKNLVVSISRKLILGRDICTEMYVCNAIM